VDYGKNIKQNVTYGNAEVRGQLRQWKKKLAQSYAIFNSSYTELMDGKLTPLVFDMIKSSRSGRKQAFDKINKALGPGVTLESANLGRGKHSLAIWSILKPRDAVTMDVPNDLPESERASLAQDCVTVNYVLIGCVDDRALVAEGLWTIEVPDHALGRAVERSRFLHPGTLIREAHLNLLDLPDTAILTLEDSTDLKSSYIKAGSGCFVGNLHVAEDASINYQLVAFVRVKTWLDENQLYEDQIVLSEKGEVGKRLGDGVLRPRPLIRFERVGNKFQVRSYLPPHR
jgi:hypothetical protein